MRCGLWASGCDATANSQKMGKNKRINKQNYRIPCNQIMLILSCSAQFPGQTQVIWANITQKDDEDMMWFSGRDKSSCLEPLLLAGSIACLMGGGLYRAEEHIEEDQSPKGAKEVRDRSSIMGGLQNGKIAGPKLVVLPSRPG